MPDHLNIFEPYERKAPGHEDALTRAFLLGLRGVPVAHAAWLHLADQAHRANHGGGIPALHSLAAPRIHMQTAAVPDGVTKVISLVQTDEEVFRTADAMPSDRRQVLDGVASYDDLALVIENKPFHGNIWEGQLDVNVPEGVQHDPRVATITWKSIVFAWGRLLESGHLGPAEVVLLGDFLDYVEEHFPKLRPYSKVGLCGHDTWRLTRRCRALAEAIAPGAVRYHRGWGHYIKLAPGQCALMVGVFPREGAEGPEITVEFDPGDTMSQARKLYRKVQLGALQRLFEQGWKVEPNLHIAHMTKNLLFMTTRLSLAAYWSQWVAQRDWLRQWRRGEFDELLSTLVSVGLAAERDLPGFEKHVTNTKRQKVNVCPGVHMQWRLPVAEAAILDSRGTLEEVVKGAILEGAAALALKTPLI